MKKKLKAPPFVMLRRDMLKDPEWQKLSCSAKILWIYLRAKFNYKTKEEVFLSYTEMKNLFAPATMSNAFKELLKKDWIKKTKFGGLFGGVSKYTFSGKYKEFFYNKKEQRFNGE